jgi:hypothetical protein
MRDYFEEQVRISGKLIAGESEFDNFDCSMCLNKLDTASISAELVLISKDLPISFLNRPTMKGLRFEGYHNSAYFVECDANQMTMHSELGHVFYCDVKEYTRVHTAGPNDFGSPIEGGSFCFYLTSNQLFQRLFTITNHAEKGLLLGWGQDREGREQWENNAVSYEFDWGKVEISPYLLSAKTEKPFHVLAETTRLTLFLTRSYANLNEAWEDATLNLADFLSVVSWIEAKQVTWTYSSGGATYDGSLVHFVEQYQRTPNSQYCIDKGFETQPAQIHRYRGLVQQAVVAFQRLPTDTKDDLAAALDRISTANLQSIAPEIALPHWYSALEILSSIVLSSTERKELSFKYKLFRACERLGVNLSDAYRIAFTDNKKGEAELDPFLVGVIRNALMHDGRLPDGIATTTVISENETARRLTRAMYFGILKYTQRKTPGSTAPAAP